MDALLPLLERAQQATLSVRTLSDHRQQSLLRSLAARLVRSAPAILAANQLDLERMADTDPKKDRLLLNDARIQSLADSLLDIAALPNPVGAVILQRTLDNGLTVEKISVPLGVVGVIYESRPNVTVDVAALCLRSGNVCVLRGGSDAIHTNTCLVGLIQEELTAHQVDTAAVQLLPVERSLVEEMLKAVRFIDIIIPRGSQQLIEYVRQHSSVPVIETGAGVCHTYVEQTARLENAARIVTNAKVSRPSVCNALDTILVDKAIAQELLQLLSASLVAYNVEIFADVAAYEILTAAAYPYLQQATLADFGREYLDYKCSVKVVADAEEALEHIRRYSSRHSEAIITENVVLGERFLQEVDAAAVYVNASTRFTDGGVFGLGAEIGISTQKLHARGPFALEKLVTEKWIVRGNGQIR
ncbi:glutamate-5-semialdehyde dehydrogenase [Chitinophaga pendula]|uniref:glutamate-5-semialdehyde dehydrogenase n=1 Tax=Chitinophaga pendula TaxID=2849666 RepID=UPI001CEC4948|nr:glutamate-5-semialdehyde dehydrogenase [Chitinophaga pendula]UCJ07802.1 glutamate-5-semialdehyde dehydrogenase [Chitinophaga pendula]